MTKSLLGMLFAYLLCAGPFLYAQPYFCSSSVESVDCEGSDGECVTQGLPCNVSQRYSLAKFTWEVNDDNPFDGLSQGDSDCEETYFFEIKKSSDDYRKSLNSERSAWNHADHIAFFLGSNTKSITFYDSTGSKVGGTDEYEFGREEFFMGVNDNILSGNWDKWHKKSVAEIRWHPTENAIIYARQVYDTLTQALIQGELVKRTLIGTSSNLTGLDTAEVLFSFPGYFVGDSDFLIAGGDGNDVNGGRLLLSLRDTASSTTLQYAVFDFAQEELVEPVLTPSTQTYSEVYHGSSSFSSAIFSLPSLGTNTEAYFDYATVSASGLFIVVRYTRPDGGTNLGTEGVWLCNLAGHVIQRKVPVLNSAPNIVDRLLKNKSGHLDVGFFKTNSGGVKECIIAKVSAGTLSNTGNGNDNSYIDGGTIDEGDILAIYWDITTSGDTIFHEAGYSKILDWDEDVNASYSGGQFSITSPVQTPHTSLFTAPAQTNINDFSYRALLSLEPFDPSNFDIEDLGRYKGEIVELSLVESDPVPRRIIHHRVIYFDSTSTNTEQKSFQPEAWMSRKGDKFFFKTYNGTDDPMDDAMSDQDLYFVNLPLRTCKSTRDDIAPTYRQGRSYSNHHFSLYPNPLSQTDQLLIDCGPEVSDAPQAVLRLISLDGRSSQVWTGTVEAGVQIQAQLTELSSGVYVAELWDVKRDVSLMREKVLLK